MSALQSDEKEFKIKYLKDLEMTRNERITRCDYTDKDIQMELEFLASNLICEKEMKLKIGAQVMSIINIQSDRGLNVCNGSQGIITGFCAVSGCPQVKFNNGIEMIMTRNIWQSDKIPGIGVSQVPLILAWALTIHKSQGATLDAAEIDVGSGIFECGQRYVALTRVKNLDGLYLTSFDASKIRINRKVKDFYDNLTLNQGENSEVVAEAHAEVVAIPVAVLVLEPRIDNNVRVIKINPTENDILERKLLEIGILH
jgi:ATP-dependent exoDNAse (exonuclease V) alpha subunit